MKQVTIQFTVNLDEIEKMDDQALEENHSTTKEQCLETKRFWEDVIYASYQEDSISNVAPIANVSVAYHTSDKTPEITLTPTAK